MTLNSEALEPCPNPWCYSHQPSDLDRRPAIYPNDDDGGPVHVACPYCGLNGPTENTVPEAIAAWNRRPADRTSFDAGWQKAKELLRPSDLVHADTRTDADGGTWSDGGKVYDPPALPSGDELVKRLAYMVENPSAWSDGFDHQGASDLIREAATRIQSLMAEVEASQRSHAAAREIFLTMQGAAASLLKRAEAAEARVKVLEEAMRKIAEGNLGDDPWQANYDKIRSAALNALGRTGE